MIIDIDTTLNKLKEDIVNKFKPERIILFGSIANSTYNYNSDIDLCIVSDTTNKRELITNLYTKIECDMPFDILVYTNEEWEKNIQDSSSFAYKINNSGVILYG